jgi:predicted deacylase
MTKSRKQEVEFITIGSVEIERGAQVRVELPITMLATQGALTMPVEVIAGEESGPILCVTSAVHGDELNGIEVIRQLIPLLSPQTICGTLVAIPIVNVPAFMTQSRYLPDRRDLNRSFPGSRSGSQASRIAHTLIEQVVKHCTHLIDIHSASMHRSNIPQIRASLNDDDVAGCARAFGAPVVVHSAERDGSLRMAAGQLGIPAIVYEAGEAGAFNNEAIDTGLMGVLGVMHWLNMISPKDIHVKKLKRTKNDSMQEWQRCKWVRATKGGLFRARVKPGQSVERDEFLGFIADAFGEGMSVLRAPQRGLVIGMTKNPVVGHGDALIHIAY